MMLRSHHRYALQSVCLVGSLMVSDWWDVRFMGRYWGGGGFGGRDNRLSVLFIRSVL